MLIDTVEMKIARVHTHTHTHTHTHRNITLEQVSKAENKRYPTPFLFMGEICTLPYTSYFGTIKKTPAKGRGIPIISWMSCMFNYCFAVCGELITWLGNSDINRIIYG